MTPLAVEHGAHLQLAACTLDNLMGSYLHHLLALQLQAQEFHLRQLLSEAAADVRDYSELLLPLVEELHRYEECPSQHWLRKL